MEFIRTYVSRLIYLFLLTLIEAILFVVNFTPKTFLVGWDNVMPELNLKLNYLRSLTAVWQDYRGLGTLDGMAHAANLFHVLYINLLSFFLPQNVLRYSFIHLTHLLGGIAFYYLANKLFKNKNGAFLATLFYLFNIGVIQMYFAPLEVFAMHFAALPVMGLALLNALKSKSKKSLVILGVASLLTTPQAFVPTVFISYSIFVAFLLIFNFKKELFKRITLIIAILFITNAFWLLPFSYSAVIKSPEIQNTRINEFSSDEIYYRNKARGTMLDTLTLKGFMLDAIEYDTFKKQNFHLMGTWLNYTKTLPFQLISYILALLMLLGSFLVVRYRIKSLYPFLASNVISFIFLANNTPVLANVNESLRLLFPLFGEAFRFPFTKFITLFAFTYAMLFGLGVSFAIKIIVNLFGRLTKNKTASKTIYGTILILFIGFIAIYAKPAFEGNFTSPFLRLTIPSGYFKTIDYFKNENPEGRILNFPLNSFWNWEYRTWGHRGSGFMWYGIPQPFLTRAFDPWSNYNEQLFNEFSNTYNNGDIKQFDILLQKYNITYVSIDTTIINTLSSKPIDYGKIEDFLNKSEILFKDKDFDQIVIYKTRVQQSTVSTLPAKSVVSVYPKTTQLNTDSLIRDSGNYVSSSKDADVILPFPSLTTLKLQKDNQFKWNYSNNVLSFNSTTFPLMSKGRKLVIPSLFENEFLIPVSVAIGENTVSITPIYPSIIINGQKINIPNTPIIINTSSVAHPTEINFIDTRTKLTLNHGDSRAFLLNNLPNTIQLTDGVNMEYAQIDTSQIDKKPLVVDVPVDTINSFTVSVDTFDTELGDSNYMKNKQYIITKASSQEEIQKTNSYTSSGIQNGGVLLEARNDSTSLDIYLDSLYHAGSYAVIANIGHESGLPAYFYVDDPQESRSVLETKFINGNNIAILNSSGINAKGYGFHLGVKSVGSEKGISIINSVTVMPIPQKTIEGIRIFNPKSFALSQINPQSTPQKDTKINNFLYKTQTQPNTIITLSQSYDSGWAAYEMPNSNPGWLYRTLPFLFGKKITNHVLVNNWANGWTINNSQFPASSSGGSNLNSQIIIVYLPQYLEYIGMIVGLIFTGVVLALSLSGINAYIAGINTFLEDKAELMKKKVTGLLS